MKLLLQEIRYALRQLRRSPGFSAAALLTLAIGIGANIATFSIVNAFLLRPLPFDRAEQLVHFFRVDQETGHDQLRFSEATYDRFQRSSSFAELGAYNYGSHNISGGGSQPERLIAGRLSASLLRALDVEPLMGRTFDEADEHGESGPVLLLSSALWQRRFGGSPNVLGQSLFVDGQEHRIVGVMKPDFVFPYGSVKFWIPLALSAQRSDTAGRNLMVVGRLREGKTAERATAEIRALFEQAKQDFYPDDPRSTVRVLPLRQALIFFFEMVRALMVIIAAASAFVLLIICTNISNLFLVRALRRDKEVAVRLALGARGWHIVRQLFSEGLVLGVGGAALGLAGSYWYLGLVSRAFPEELFRVGEIQIDGPAFAVTAGLAIVSAVLFTLPPALQVLRTDLTRALKADASAPEKGGKGHRIRDFQVVAQITLSIMLLVGTLLAVRSFFNLQVADPGFDERNVLSLEMHLPRRGFEETDRVASVYRDVLQSLESIPGVEGAALVRPLPLNFESHGREVTLVGHPQYEDKPFLVLEHIVSERYFDVMRIPVRDGRPFNASDGADSERVVLVNQHMADKYWPAESPVGRLVRFASGHHAEEVARVVGVVPDTKQVALMDKASPMIYVAQSQEPARQAFVVLRTTAAPLASAVAARQAIHRVVNDLPVSHVRPMATVLAESLNPWRWSTVILGAFTVISLVLAGIGVFSVIAYAASQRTREIAVRIALGARVRAIVSLVMKRALVLTAVGFALGLASSLALSQVLRNVLFGIEALDPVTYVGAAVLLAGVGALASFLPALRALRTQPATALRLE